MAFTRSNNLPPFNSHCYCLYDNELGGSTTFWTLKMGMKTIVEHLRGLKMFQMPKPLYFFLHCHCIIHMIYKLCCHIYSLTLTMALPMLFSEISKPMNILNIDYFTANVLTKAILGDTWSSYQMINFHRKHK